MSDDFIHTLLLMFMTAAITTFILGQVHIGSFPYQRALGAVCVPGYVKETSVDGVYCRDDLGKVWFVTEDEVTKWAK